MKRLAAVLGMLFILAALASAADTFVEKRFAATVDPDGTQRVSILAGAYFFDPNVIVVKADVPVELSVKREAGITPHDFVLKAPEAGIDIKTDLATEPKVVKFTATKPGRYPFECSERFLFFTSHKDRGMHGILEVVADQTTGKQTADKPGPDDSQQTADRPTTTTP